MKGAFMKVLLTSDQHKQQLNNIVSKFIIFYNNNYDYDQIVYTNWSAKDILGHVVMWHESFARNVDDIVNGRKPNPLKGTLTDINEKGVLISKDVTIIELLRRMKKAHDIIMNNILDKNIDMIPYRKGSRDYTKDEHLEVVYRHIEGHLLDLEKAYTSSKI